MNKPHIYRWFAASIALLLLIMPVLLADELSLLTNWLFAYTCWLVIIAIGLIKTPSSRRKNTKSKGQ
jgi:hypothetical protein